MDGTSPLRVGLLGRLTATRGDVPLDLGGPRQRAVLALLVLARGEVVPAERLAASVWADRGATGTMGGLQAYVSHLRRRLQPESAARTRSAVIVREGPGYAVRLPDDAVDAWRFESLLTEAGRVADPAAAVGLLTEALGLWRGPALADYADDPWAEAEIGRLTELRAVSRERLLAARLELGEAALLVPDLETLVAEEPLREERWRLLVLALYRAQRQADALAALRRARSTLADELGVDPGPALARLEQEVLAQSPDLDGRRPPAPATEPLVPRPRAPATPDDLADRDRELRALRAALGDLAEGQPGLLLVEGPPGIGKTRLLTEARRLAAERGLRVLTARGSQLERAYGFGVVRQLFEPELAAEERRERLLGGTAAGARGVFDLAGGEPGEGAFAVLHGLYWLAVNITGSGPLLLAVDDLQWCDDASLRFLAYLARRLDAVPVLVVGTVRTGEPHEAEELLAELQLEPAAVVVRPPPLSAEATAGIVGRRLGEPVSPLFTRACHRTTSGNPLLLRQLLRALEADGVRPDAAHADTVVAVGSRAVSSMVLLRLRRLPEPAAAVARAAAVLGDGATLPTVARLAGLDEAGTAAALAALTRAEVIRDQHPLAFVHPLVREAVYRDLPAPERALLHERAAGVLRAAGEPDERVAAQLLRAPLRGDDGTVAVLRRAASTAAERGASDSAVVLLRRALDEPPGPGLRGEVLRRLGLIEAMLDGAAGAGHLLEAYGLADDPGVRAELAVAIAGTQVFAGPPGAATAFAREAASVVPPELADHRQALLALERISGYMHGLPQEVWRGATPPEASSDGPGARMLAATLAWEAAIDGRHRERAVGLARFALAGDRLWAVDQGLFWIVAALVRMLADDDLGDFWARASAHAYAHGSLFNVQSANLWQAYWLWRRGELDEALACLDTALDQARRWGSQVGEPYARAFQIACQLDRGDLPAARRVADTALAGTHLGEGDRLLHQAIARLLVVEGRPAEALAVLDAVPRSVQIRNPAWSWRGTAEIAALHALGRREEAIGLAEEEVALLRRWGAPTYLGTALRRLGRLLGSAGVEHLREAVTVLEPTSAVVELARARCMLGSVPAVPDAEAVPALQAAASAAHAVGAAALRERACAALHARGHREEFHGIPVRRPSLSERRVRDLAAEGLPPVEIAQRLFLTPGRVLALLDGGTGGIDGGTGGGTGGDDRGRGLNFFSSPPPEALPNESRGRGVR